MLFLTAGCTKEPAMNPYVIGIAVVVCLVAVFFVCAHVLRRKDAPAPPAEAPIEHVDDIQFARMLLRLSEVGAVFDLYKIDRTDQSGGTALSVSHPVHGELFRAFWTAESLKADSFPLQISALRSASPKAVREMRDFFVVTYHHRFV